MTHDTKYETCGTSALKPVEMPRLRVYAGGRGLGPASAHRTFRADDGRASALLVTLAAVVLAMVFAVAVCAVDAHGEAVARARFDAAPHEVTYVQQGDSLWSIAQRQGAGMADTAQLVSWIRDANGLTGLTLHEGEAVVVPVLEQ